MMKNISALLVLFVFSGCTFDATTGEGEEENDNQVGYSDQEVAEPGRTFKHCVVDTTLAAADESEDIESASPTPQCFRTFSQAVNFATSGRVQLPHDATPEDVDDESLNGAQLMPVATFVIGIEYQHASFGGATLTFTSNLTCAGYTLSVNSLPAGWDNIITSARAFSNCNHSYHYEHTFQGGAIRDCFSSCSNIGEAMNDRTSSIRWTQ